MAWQLESEAEKPNHHSLEQKTKRVSRLWPVRAKSVFVRDRMRQELLLARDEF